MGCQTLNFTDFKISRFGYLSVVTVYFMSGTNLVKKRAGGAFKGLEKPQFSKFNLLCEPESEPPNLVLCFISWICFSVQNFIAWKTWLVYSIAFHHVHSVAHSTLCIFCSIIKYTTVSNLEYHKGMLKFFGQSQPLSEHCLDSMVCVTPCVVTSGIIELK